MIIQNFDKDQLLNIVFYESRNLVFSRREIDVSRIVFRKVNKIKLLPDLKDSGSSSMSLF